MPELFDVVELLVTLPESNLHQGTRGAIVDCYDDGNYEVEFSDRSGETIALCTLSVEQFLVVWKSKERRWLSVSELLSYSTSKLHFLCGRDAYPTRTLLNFDCAV